MTFQGKRESDSTMTQNSTISQREVCLENVFLGPDVWRNSASEFYTCILSARTSANGRTRFWRARFQAASSVNSGERSSFDQNSSDGPLGGPILINLHQSILEFRTSEMVSANRVAGINPPIDATDLRRKFSINPGSHMDWQNPAEFFPKGRPTRNFSIDHTSSIWTSSALRPSRVKFA